jgi:hypothetical protein
VTPNSFFANPKIPFWSPPVDPRFPIECEGECCDGDEGDSGEADGYSANDARPVVVFLDVTRTNFRILESTLSLNFDYFVIDTCATFSAHLIFASKVRALLSAYRHYTNTTIN